MNPKIDRFEVSITCGNDIEKDINQSLENRNLNANAVISIVPNLFPGTLTVFFKIGS